MNATERRQVDAAALASVLADPDSFSRARRAEAERQAEIDADNTPERITRKAAAKRAWDRASEETRRKVRADARVYDDPDGAMGVCLDFYS